MSRQAVLSPAFALAGVFLAMAAWNVSSLLAFWAVAAFSGGGLTFGIRAHRRIHRHHGALRGAESAIMGIWVNSALLVVSLPFLAMGTIQFLLQDV